VLALAIAAVATAWSGYQAVRGDGRQSVLYAESSRARFQADAAATVGGQQLVADALMFTPQCRNPQQERAERLDAQAADAFERGRRPVRPPTGTCG
jgi:hypothetical protein